MTLPPQLEKEKISRNVSAVHLIVIIFCFISGLYKLFLEKIIFLVKSNTTILQCIFFHIE